MEDAVRRSAHNDIGLFPKGAPVVVAWYSFFFFPTNQLHHRLVSHKDIGLFRMPHAFS